MAILGVFGQGGGEGRIEPCEVGMGEAESGGGSGEMVADQSGGLGRVERCGAGEELIGRARQGVLIRECGRRAALDDLGRAVGQGADDGVGCGQWCGVAAGELGDPEVQDDDPVDLLC